MPKETISNISLWGQPTVVWTLIACARAGTTSKCSAASPTLCAQLKRSESPLTSRTTIKVTYNTSQSNKYSRNQCHRYTTDQSSAATLTAPSWLTTTSCRQWTPTQTSTRASRMTITWKTMDFQLFPPILITTRYPKIITRTTKLRSAAKGLKNLRVQTQTFLTDAILTEDCSLTTLTINKSALKWASISRYLRYSRISRFYSLLK